MCAFGFGYVMTPIFDHGEAYALSFTVFYGMLKIGGICLLLIAAVCWTGRPIALVLDAIVTTLCGLIMVGCAVCWTIFEKSMDLQNLLIFIVGIMFTRSGFANGSLFVRGEGAFEGKSGGKSWFGIPTLEPPGAQEPPVPEVPHPASLKSDALPGEGEPPPDEGYLAALSKEKDEPPSASYE